MCYNLIGGKVGRKPRHTAKAPQGAPKWVAGADFSTEKKVPSPQGGKLLGSLMRQGAR
jgi:hypothetical protein